MELRRVLVELKALEDAGVVSRYAIGGAVGATAYVAAAATDDVDVFVIFRGDSATSLAPLSPIYEFLSARGADVDGEHLIIGGWPVQILPAASGLLEEAVTRAPEAEVSGVRTRIFSAEHLAAIALELGRAKDHTRVVQMFESAVLDDSVFSDIVTRYGLEVKLAAFKQRFMGGA